MTKSMTVLALLALSVSAAHADMTVLEMKRDSGQGWMMKDIVVDCDGDVTETHMISPPANESQPRLIAQLSSLELAQIQDSISKIQQQPLVRTNPNQFFNPGGVTTSYILTYYTGETFTFAQTVSGVDFGLTGNQGQDLVAILQGLANQASAN